MSSKVLIVGKLANPKNSVLVTNSYFSPTSVSFCVVIFAFSAWLYAVILQDLLKSIIQTNNFSSCLQWHVTDENDVESRGSLCRKASSEVCADHIFTKKNIVTSDLNIANKSFSFFFFCELQYKAHLQVSAMTVTSG